MSEEEFGKALTRGDDPIDVAALTARVLRRDKRRVWLLGIACIVAWMAVVMVPWATLLPMLAKVATLNRVVVPTPAEQQRHAVLVAEVLKKGIVVTFVDNVIAMFVAALCTVLLIIASRRATLRQVNARLAEISASIRALGKASQ